MRLADQIEQQYRTQYEEGTHPLRRAVRVLRHQEDHIAALEAGERILLRVLRDCYDYLNAIPESAAGGDDDARWLAKRAQMALLPHAKETA